MSRSIRGTAKWVIVLPWEWISLVCESRMFWLAVTWLDFITKTGIVVNLHESRLFEKTRLNSISQVSIFFSHHELRLWQMINCLHYGDFFSLGTSERQAKRAEWPEKREVFAKEKKSNCLLLVCPIFVVLRSKNNLILRGKGETSGMECILCRSVLLSNRQRRSFFRLFYLKDFLELFPLACKHFTSLLVSLSFTRKINE